MYADNGGEEEETVVLVAAEDHSGSVAEVDAIDASGPVHDMVMQHATHREKEQTDTNHDQSSSNWENNCERSDGIVIHRIFHKMVA